ncbi:MAG: ABC transporter permease subunit [Acidimicrobiia bacterium]
MTVLARWLRDRARSTAWWALGVGLTVLVTMALFPTLQGDGSVDDIFKDLPDSLKSAFGISDQVSLTSAAGYLQSQLVGTMLPILLIVFGIAAGARAIGGAEEEGRLELLLANPVTRRRVAAERALGVAVQVVALGAATAACTIGSAAAFGALEDVSMPGFVVALAATTSLGLLHAAVAFAVGAAVGRRGPALAVAAAVAVVGYLLQALGTMASVIEPLAVVSPWHWFLERNMLAEGPDWMALLAPVAIALVVAQAGMLRFQGRDLR